MGNNFVAFFVYPPAFIPPLPNDKTSDGWYCNRDLRREVEPSKSIAQIPEAINDSKYPVLKALKNAT